MSTLSVSINKAVRVSRKEFPDQIIVLFCKGDKDYSCILESEYTSEDEYIVARYLNGEIIKDT
jgi:hypothetical protein